ncbi:hypothetical protein GT030_07460, partial [Streptomyces sp. SID1328]|nr:hypothetical protein [Streptomyces sp. SID1328]
AEPLTGHNGPVNAVACTLLDNTPIAVTGSSDHTVRLWDLTTGQPIAEPLTGHIDTVTDVVSTVLEGTPIAATTSWDNTVRVWDLRSRKLVQKLIAPSCQGACFTNNGRLVVGLGRDLAVLHRNQASPGQGYGAPTPLSPD